MTTTAYLAGYQRAMAELLARAAANVPPPEGMTAEALTGYHRGRRDFLENAEQMAQPWLPEREDEHGED